MFYFVFGIMYLKPFAHQISQRNIMLFFFGILVFVISDYGFMYFDSINEYYTGHLVDIPYIWAYAIFISGIIGNWNLWNRTSKNKPFNDQNTMR